MAAPIVWAPGSFAFFLQEKTPTPIKFLVLEGGGLLGFVFLGGECRFQFYGRGGFAESCQVTKLLLSAGT